MIASLLRVLPINALALRVHKREWKSLLLVENYRIRIAYCDPDFFILKRLVELSAYKALC